ncbi:MAG: cadherin repeat domain-containing protein, partial [Gammaproteobacteria bacterium]|nr:cadherin repeat domain-containing protein [Gammaproteobacteria bacterium]
IVYLTVDPVNDPPVINLSAGNDTFNATVGVPFILNISASDPVENHTIIAFYDNTTLFDIERETGEINFTPTEADIGNHTINITVWDSGDDDTLPAVSWYSNFTIIVNITNRPPVIDPVENQDARQGELLVVPINYYDRDPDENLSLQIDIITNATITALEWNATSGNLTWNATNDDVIALAPYNFTFTVNFTVTDLGNLSAWTAFNISLMNANDPPSAPGIGLNDTMDFEEGDNGTYNITTPDLVVHFWGFPAADPDLEIPYDQEDIPGYSDEELDYSWDFGDGDSEGDDGTLEMSHQYAAPGNYTVNLTVIDDGKLEAVATLKITLLLEEAAGFTPAELTQEYTDPEGDVYSYAISFDLDQALNVVSGGKNTDKRPEMDLVSLGSEYVEGEASFTVTLKAAANISTEATDEYWLVIVPQGTQEDGSHLGGEDLKGSTFDYIWPSSMFAKLYYNPWTEAVDAYTASDSPFLLVGDDEITVQRSGKRLTFTIALSALPKMGIDPGTAVDFWGVTLGFANRNTEDLEEIQKILEGKTWLGQEYFDTIGPGAANMTGMSTWGAFSGGDGEDDDGLSDAAVAALAIIMVVVIIIILIALLVAKGRVKDEVIVEEDGAEAPAMRESMGWEGGYEDEFEFECPDCSTPVPLDLEG